MDLNESEEVAHYVRELARPRPGHAWHALVEMGPTALPLIVQAFEAARDRSVALELIRVVNEYRTHAALPFLTDLLRAEDPDNWKTPLDGIVMLGGRESAKVLRELCQSANAEKRGWFEEAIEQIDEGDGHSG